MHIVQQIDVIFLDPVRHMIHSIRLHRYDKFCLSFTVLLLDFERYCLASASLILVLHTLQCGQGISVSAVELVLTDNSFRCSYLGQSNCFPLPVLACSPCNGQRPLLACRPRFGRLLDIGFAIAVATARPASLRCRHHSHRR